MYGSEKVKIVDYNIWSISFHVVDRTITCILSSHCHNIHCTIVTIITVLF